MEVSSRIQSVDKKTNANLFKMIFDRYAEETITEEQIQRILAPVIVMIFQGRFDKSFWMRYDWLLKPLITLVGVVLLIIIVALG